jgi:hypothetical protein
VFRLALRLILATFFAALALICALMVEVSALMAPLWWEVMWTALCLLFIYGIREIFRDK